MTEKYYPKFIIDGHELAFDGRQPYVKYDKYYPVRSFKVELYSKTAYLVNRNGGLAITSYVDPYDRFLFTIEAGDAFITIDSPDARAIGKQYLIFTIGNENRDILSDFYRFIHSMDGSRIPTHVIGSITDVSDQNLAMHMTAIGKPVHGTCGYCNSPAFDTCSICETKLCRSHDIAAEDERFPMLLLGYCEDCLYCLNLIDNRKGVKV